MRERMKLPPLSEYLDDLLTFDAWIDGRTKGQQALAILSDGLKNKEQLINDRLVQLAKKRHISLDALKIQILAGDAEMQ